EQLRHLMNAYQGAWEIERKWRVQTRTQQNPLSRMSQQAQAAARTPVSTPPRTAQETARDMIERSARGEPLGIAPGVREPSRGRRQRPRVQVPPSSQEQRQEGVLPIGLSSFADPEN